MADRTTIYDPHARIPGWSLHLTDYQPAWRDFERMCGTMADDECEHGRTPLERERDPSVCPCSTTV